MREVRILEEICEGECFSTELQGIKYCQLAYQEDRHIDCFYLSKERDHNDLRSCKYYEYNKIITKYTQ